MPEIAETFVMAAQLAHVLDVPLAGSVEVCPRMDHLPNWNKPVLKAVYHRCQEARVLEGHRPSFVRHFGKVVRLNFEDTDNCLDFHFGMTGRLSFENGKHARMQFRFRADRDLFFVDTRKFGKVVLTHQSTSLVEGMDAYTLSWRDLNCFCTRSRRRIRDVLTDQSKIAGT